MWVRKRGPGPQAGAALVNEGFGGLDEGTQRYIRRALDVGIARRDALSVSRDPAECGLRAQQRIYAG